MNRKSNYSGNMSSATFDTMSSFFALIYMQDCLKLIHIFMRVYSVQKNKINVFVNNKKHRKSNLLFDVSLIQKNWSKKQWYKRKKNILNE